MPDDNTGSISPEHAAFLSGQAVDPDLAYNLGVRSLLSRDDTQAMGGHWVNWANFPALAFPWVSDDGRLEYQVRPDTPTEGNKGRVRKYVFRKGSMPVLWAVRPNDDAEVVAIIEGTKQCLAGASYAPEGVAVYGIAGCRMWQLEGQPIPDLMTVDGRKVVVVLDADAATNPDVYAAGVELEKALLMEGATSVVFARLVGADKAGLDDILGGRPPARRASYFKRVIDGAKPKPADKVPVKKKPGGEKPMDDEGKRVTIVVNEDRLEVINELTEALLNRWNAVELFNHGGVISRRKADGMHPVDKGSFNNLVQETCKTVNKNEGANGVTYSAAWPDPNTMAATASRSDRFAQLDRVSHAPFVRADGTIVTEAGYDESTRTLLVPDPVFDGIKVPDDPSPTEIAAARDLILNEWLGDFPLYEAADRANLMALIVTPAIRGMVPKVPMCVIDGLQMGVGKNLLADQILTVYTGRAAEPMNWVPDPEELRKQITAAFRTGAEFFVFDEAHTVEGAPLAQALTAATWQDRILGVSTMANFPNVITWISLGNQVQVRGDLARRVYRVALRPAYANPQDRKAETFRHPGQSGLDLATWTRTHRRELMTAILTIVRSWFAAGQPRPERGVSFGSFEAWERITGGIVEKAGLPDFLGNLKVWRSESDFDTQYWTGHLGWLREQFGATPFRTSQVKALAMEDPAAYMAPPKLDDPADKGFGKSLGESYARLRGRRYGDFWLEREGQAHGHVTLWRVYDQNDDLPPAPGTEPSPPVDPPPWDEDGPDDVCRCSRTERVYCHASGCHGGADTEPDSPQVDPQPVDAPPPGEVTPVRTDTDVVTFDLETGDVDDLYRADGAEYVRIGATADDDQDAVPYDGPGTSVPRAVAADIRRGQTITGHNIMAFDLPALVRAGAMTMDDVHDLAAEGRVFDGLLAARYLDPPMARDKGVDQQRKYDLGTLAVSLGLGEKYTDLSKPLATKYGGWGAIPIDVNDPDEERAADARSFQTYMIQDVELSRRLHAELMDRLGGEVPEYLKREHRVAALAAQIRDNGFKVDQDLLNERVTEVNERKAEAIGWLHDNAGVPLTDAKGKAYKSPLATKAGKEAVGAAFVAAGVPEKSLWRTEKSGDLQLTADAMRHLAAEYHHLPEVRELAKNVYRIVGSRSVYQTLLDNLMPDGRVHPRIGFDQSTGRWSITRPGLTVLGKRGGRVVERAVLVPEPGNVLLSADLSQVDMRALAGLSQDRAYIKMLESEDPHTDIAIALFGDKEKRELAKAIGHGWNYGRGLKAISESHDIEPRLVRQFDTSMRERFGRLVEWQGEVRSQAEAGMLLDNGWGRKMRADPHRSHTQGPALMGQGCARDLMMEGLLRLPREVLPLLRAQVHDEIVVEAPEKDAEEIGRIVVEALSFEWRGVQILADVSRPGSTWADCYRKG